jgi:tRNA 2-thiocytidine biosynthesis protein TtcA
MILEKKLNHNIGKLIYEKKLIQDGDKILIALSGGKDSWALCYFLKEFQKKAPIKFEINSCTLDMQFSINQKTLIQEHAEKLNISHIFYENEIIKIIDDKKRVGSSYCSFCARLRRAYLYEAAEKLNCNKVALGHHLDDAVETYLMNILYQGRTMGMPAKIKAKNTDNMELIRPMLYCEEKDIISFTQKITPPLIACNCHDKVPKNSRRTYVKSLLLSLEKNCNGTKQTIITSMKNIINDHIL